MKSFTQDAGPHVSRAVDQLLYVLLSKVDSFLTFLKSASVTWRRGEFCCPFDLENSDGPHYLSFWKVSFCQTLIPVAQIQLQIEQAVPRPTL